MRKYAIPDLGPLRRKPAFPDAAMQRRTATWILRAVLHTKEGRAWCGRLKNGYDDEATARMNEILGKFGPVKTIDSAFLGRARRALAYYEAMPNGPEENVFRNVDLLGEALGLTKVDKEILAFAVCLSFDEQLSDLMTQCARMSRNAFMAFFSAILAVDRTELVRAFSRDGALRTLQMVEAEMSPARTMHRVEVEDSLVEILCDDYECAADLMRRFAQPSEPPTLTAGNYPHLKSAVAVLEEYLRAALQSHRAGVNVLLYGPPGTGKTELARLLAKLAACELYEVQVNEQDGDPACQSQRTRSYVVTMRYLTNRPRALLLFDEAEDFFTASSWDLFFGVRRQDQYKGWIDAALEKNNVPTIWIVNQAGHIDPAVLRRFDVVLEMRHPPRSVRLDVLRQKLAGLHFDEATVLQAAENEFLTPADVEAISRVMKMTGCEHADQPANFPAGREVFRLLSEERLRVRGEMARIRPFSVNGLSWNASFVNANCDLESVIAALKSASGARLCLYGASGTGKTAFADELAKRIDRPLLARRASDILGPFVGMTEAAIAEMFRAARDEGAVLLLDEADSFLQERERAHHSWEVTMVNEVLVQMEAFEGVFVCSTNLAERLDPATLRRFDLKIRFDFLTPEQRAALFAKTLAVLNLPTTAETLSKYNRALGDLTRLTPGDFALAVRQGRMLGGIREPGDLLNVLWKEHQAKKEKEKTVPPATKLPSSDEFNA